MNKLKAFLASILFLVATLTVLATGQANANSHLNCDAYAQAAVDQHVKNVKLKCGFGGAAWQSNYNAHKNWCNDPSRTISQISIEDTNRKKALEQCGKGKLVIIPLQFKDCNKYAQNAIDQQVANVDLKCGFSGPRWSSNYGAHRDWCAQDNVSVQMANNETGSRGFALLGCLQKP